MPYIDPSRTFVGEYYCIFTLTYGRNLLTGEKLGTDVRGEIYRIHAEPLEEETRFRLNSEPVEIWLPVVNVQHLEYEKQILQVIFDPQFVFSDLKQAPDITKRALERPPHYDPITRT